MIINEMLLYISGVITLLNQFDMDYVVQGLLFTVLFYHRNCLCLANLAHLRLHYSDRPFSGVSKGPVCEIEDEWVPAAVDKER